MDLRKPHAKRRADSFLGTPLAIRPQDTHLTITLLSPSKPIIDFFLCSQPFGLLVSTTQVKPRRLRSLFVSFNRHESNNQTWFHRAVFQRSCEITASSLVARSRSNTVKQRSLLNIEPISVRVEQRSSIDSSDFTWSFLFARYLKPL